VWLEVLYALGLFAFLLLAALAMMAGWWWLLADLAGLL
jgi:hypothetical protein